MFEAVKPSGEFLDAWCASGVSALLDPLADEPAGTQVLGSGLFPYPVQQRLG